LNNKKIKKFKKNQKNQKKQKFIFLIVSHPEGGCETSALCAVMDPIITTLRVDEIFVFFVSIR